MTKTNEELIEEFNRLEEMCDGDSDQIVAMYRRNIRSLLTQKDAEVQKAREREAYLWFENWYSYYKAPLTAESNQDFGKWATERLQTLGADHSELDQPNK